MRHLPSWLLPALVALTACSDDTATTVDTSTVDLDATPFVPDAGPPDALPSDVDAAPFVPTGSCDDGTVRVLRVAPWPGRGLQITLELRTPEGAPATEGEAISARLLSPGGEHEAVIKKAWQTGGITGVIVVPSPDAATHAARVAAARAFVAALPERERVALWAASVPVTLLAELTDEKAHLDARLAALAPSAGSAPAGPQLSGIRQALVAAEGAYGPPSRHLVIVDADAGDPDALPLVAIQTSWLLPGEDGASLAADLVARRYGIVRVGACPGAAKGEVLTLELDGTPCALKAPAPIDHMTEEPCDPAAAALDDYPFPATIELSFTATERAAWQARKQANSKEDFRTSVRLGAGSPIAATAHLRGHTSLSCDRRNYNVNLDGGDERRLAPGAATDKFYLISMCKDVGYFNQTFAARLLAPLGVFNLQWRYVRLVEDGVDRGAYLLLEQPDEGLVQDHVDLAAIIRRRFDPEDQPEDVKLAKAGNAKALAAYEAVVDIAQKAPLDELEQRLGEVLDVDAYLRWLAFMTFMVNGDYVDEVYFYGAEEAGHVYFRILNWDPDDLFSPCHHGSKFAYKDPAGILYCSEGKIDEAVLRSPALYGRFVQHLEQVMADHPADKLAWTMGEIRDQLFAVVATDATAKAMGELQQSHPDAGTQAGFRKVVTTLTEEMLAAAEASRKDLKAKIVVWRASR
ncbi:MAG: hypothetical protein AMXMBFR64_12810 [Myxococcales bacterium]